MTLNFQTVLSKSFINSYVFLKVLSSKNDNVIKQTNDIVNARCHMETMAAELPETKDSLNLAVLNVCMF